jgi:3-deoxy-manno-octulosonate cytidylyltransferase (CMP-KDO synthetase)
MKIIGVIPARYGSSRLPGKPLADICGRPMVWWVYQQATKVAELTDVVVATDDERVVAVCNEHKIKNVLTGTHSTHIERIHELSTKFEADYYLNINGDEPLIEATTIQAVIPDCIYKKPKVFGLLKEIQDPVDLTDPTNIKVVTNREGVGMYMSRSPIPTPYKTVMFRYRKAIGIECFNKAALDFYVKTKPGITETIEDISPLRFFENGYPIVYKTVESHSLSVDTSKDLEKVREIIEKNLNNTPPPP